QRTPDAHRGSAACWGPAYNGTRWPPGRHAQRRTTMKRLKRGIAILLAASVASTGFMHTAQATLIGTEQVAQASEMQTDDRSRIDAALMRVDIRERLQELGVDPQHAAERIAALTDEEAA